MSFPPSDPTIAALLWGVGQATVVALAAAMLLPTLCRGEAATRVRLAAATLFCMTLLPALMLLPLEDILSPAPSTGDANAAAVAFAAPEGATDPGDDELPAAYAPAAIDRLAAWLASAEFDQPLSETAEAAPPRRSWLLIGAVAMAVAVAAGTLRLLAGWLQVRRLVQASIPCDSPAVNAALDEMLAQMPIRGGLDCRVTDRLDTPALVGCWRMTLLMPQCCDGWSEQELRAAVAHELSHARRRDVFWTTAAQAALAINYYHPLAHLLVRRMRLDQELAADELAAGVAGGRGQYLRTLAGLALRRADRTVGGPALAFLPARRHFLRRLEMLRNLPRVRRGAKPLAALAAAAVFASALTVATLRPSFAQAPRGAGQIDPRAAGQVDPRDPAAGPRSEDLPPLRNYVPEPVSAGWVDVDVATLLAGPMGSAIQSAVPAEEQELKISGASIPLTDVERVVMVLPQEMRQSEPSLLVRFKRPVDIREEDRVKKLDARTFAFTKDDVTLFRAALLTPRTDDVTSPGAVPAEIRARLDVRSLRDEFRDLPPQAAVFAPLWQEVDTVDYFVRVGRSVDVEARFDTAKPEVVADTLQAARTLALNALRSMPQMQGDARGPVEGFADWSKLAKLLAEPVLRSIQIEPGDRLVIVRASFGEAGPFVLQQLASSIRGARQSADRTRSMNNMRQIMIALHNYHEVHGHLPPSVIEENGVKRSWRVEILPYLEQQALYNMYRKDKAWDAPENEQLRKVVIGVYKSSGAETTMTGYRGISGEHGMLGTAGKPVGFRDTTDGTSNTIAVVETNDFVHWAEPDEYSPSPEELVKSAAERDGFNVAMADGRVVFISNTIDRSILKALLTRDGGESAADATATQTGGRFSPAEDAGSAIPVPQPATPRIER